MRLAYILLMLTTPVAAQPPHIVGPEETVFDWRSQRCAIWDIPDGAARAWKDAGDQVYFVSPSEQSRLSRGASLERLTRDCSVAHEGKHEDSPASYDDRTWLSSTFLKSNGRLIALAHVEYHGHRRSEKCLAGTYSACWWNTIVELESKDGTHFEKPDGAKALVAAPPQKYQITQTRRTGYFNPSNILENDGYLYAMIFAEDTQQQQRGACLIRRRVNGTASDWRAWDGHDFNATFIDPYRDQVDEPERHTCAPLRGIVSTISSIVRRGDIFLAITPAMMTSDSGTKESGLWTLTSKDLIHWSRPHLLISIPLLWRRDCSKDAAYAYPSFLDPNSADRNFNTVDERFFVYLAKIYLGPNCKSGPRRDIVRIPINWPEQESKGTDP